MEEKETLNNVSLSQLLETETNNISANGRSAIYGQSCIVVHNLEINSNQKKIVILQQPTRINTIWAVLCLSGEAEVQCDLQHCYLQENSLFLCKPGVILHVLSGHISKLSALVMDHPVNETINISFQKLLPHYFELEELITVSLDFSERQRLNTLFGFLYNSILSDHSQILYHECIHAQLTSLTFEILRQFSNNIPIIHQPDIKFTRQQEYFRKFIYLLGIHFREQHHLSFYADKIHITPKYLGKLILQISGRKASDWINDYIMSEARTLLRNTGMSIQEITYSLNFPNQSFFGRYFKTHEGISPSEFRCDRERL